MRGKIVGAQLSLRDPTGLAGSRFRCFRAVWGGAGRKCGEDLLFASRLIQHFSIGRRNQITPRLSRGDHQ